MDLSSPESGLLTCSNKIGGHYETSDDYFGHADAACSTVHGDGSIAMIVVFLAFGLLMLFGCHIIDEAMR